MIFSFGDRVHLTQLQLLSHEFCIPSKAELWVQDVDVSRPDASPSNSSFRRLGFLSFDPNKGSNYESRELKSVRLDVNTEMIKLVLHDPHPNQFNQFSQVGLISVKCSGEPILPVPTKASTRYHDDDRTHSLIAELERMRTLPSDPDSASAYKSSMREILMIGDKIRELESKKQSAINREDYDSAKLIKLSISDLRTQQDACMHPVTAPTFGVDPNQSSTPSIDPIPMPDALPTYFEREYPELFQSVPKEIIEYLLSRDWRLREMGLRNLIALPVTDPYVLNWVIKRFVTEKMVNLYERTVELLLDCIARGIKPNTESLEFAVIDMVEFRLAETNKRVRDCTVSGLTILTDKYLPLVSHYLLKPARMETKNPKQIRGKCVVLQDIIQSKGVRSSSDQQTGVPFEPLLSALGRWLNSVPELKSLLRELFQLAALKVRGNVDDVEIIIAGLPGQVKDTLMFEYQRMSPPSEDKSTPLPRVKPASVSPPCDFCGISDPSFVSQDALDRHYWHKCPALIECRFCEQVVELVGLTEHRLKECEKIVEASRGLQPLMDRSRDDIN